MIGDPIAHRFAENLLALRRRADLSQEQLGFAAELHRTEIGMLERGVRIARIDTLAKLAGALEVTPNVLMAGIVWRPSQVPSRGGFLTSPASQEIH